MIARVCCIAPGAPIGGCDPPQAASNAATLMLNPLPARIVAVLTLSDFRKKCLSQSRLTRIVRTAPTPIRDEALVKIKSFRVAQLRSQFGDCVASFEERAAFVPALAVLAATTPTSRSAFLERCDKFSCELKLSSLKVEFEFTPTLFGRHVARRSDSALRSALGAEKINWECALFEFVLPILPP